MAMAYHGHVIDLTFEVCYTSLVRRLTPCLICPNGNDLQVDGCYKVARLSDKLVN